MKRLFILLLLAATPLFAQLRELKCPLLYPLRDVHGNWQWMDRDCKLRTRAELDKVLADHKQWLTRYPAFDHRFSPLGSNDPLRADLNGAYLVWADLNGAQLRGAALNGADLRDADLTGANLARADLTRATLFSVDLTGAQLFEADLTGAYLGSAHLTGAYFVDADLTRADLYQADLTGAQLRSAHLTDADFAGADLSEAKLEETDLSSADFTGAQLWNVDFQPKVIPAASGIARAEGLWTLRWNQLSKQESKLSFWRRVALWFHGSSAEGNRIPMQDLRKALHDAGYVEAEGQVNLAYHRMEQAWWQKVLFDWSCEWGSNWRRPFQIVAWLGLACSVVYWALLRFTRRNRLYVIGKKGKREQRLEVGQRDPAPGWFRGEGLGWRQRLVGSPWRRMRWELRLYWTAALFSLMSVLNLGVQGLDLGRWVRLIHRREFDLQARGWIRTVAGVQSLLSVALLALAVISYLGHPIE